MRRYRFRADRRQTGSNDTVGSPEITSGGLGHNAGKGTAGLAPINSARRADRGFDTMSCTEQHVRATTAIRRSQI